MVYRSIFISLSADAVAKLKSRRFPTRFEIEGDPQGDGGIARDVTYLSRVYAHNLVNK